MRIELDIQNENAYSIDETRLQVIVGHVLEQFDLSESVGLSIVFTDNDAQQALNRQFRQIDAPTDVLSFPADPVPPEFTDGIQYLGDLVIAYPYASVQAQREGHVLGDSIGVLVVHGCLHLLGYDHDTFENRAEMWVVQADCLAGLGIDPQIVPDLEGFRDEEDG